MVYSLRETELEDTLDIFKVKMLETLEENQDKSIRNIDIEDLWFDMRKHYWRLNGLMDETVRDDARISDELIDVANFCLMIFGKINKIL